MNIYLMRHAKAEPFVNSDADRALTAYGHSQVKQAAKDFIEREWELPKKIISSPYVRAQQTAQLLGQAFSIHDIKVVSYHDATHWDEMRTYIMNEPILFVSHQPSLSITIEELTGDYLSVSKASIHWLDYDIERDRAKYMGGIEVE